MILIFLLGNTSTPLMKHFSSDLPNDHSLLLKRSSSANKTLGILPKSNSWLNLYFPSSAKPVNMTPLSTKILYTCISSFKVTKKLLKYNLTMPKISEYSRLLLSLILHYSTSSALGCTMQESTCCGII